MSYCRQYIKKFIYLLALNILLISCAPTATQLKSGKLQVMVDPMAGSSFAEIKSTADAKCKELNRGTATNVRKTGGHALNWYYYGFECSVSEKMLETNKKQEEESKKQIELASLIDKAKKTCTSLGFKEGTEKFSDCSLKLYTQSVELAAEQNKSVVMQPQSSGSNVMTIYDPVRDSNALIKQGQRMMSGACTLGVNC